MLRFKEYLIEVQNLQSAHLLSSSNYRDMILSAIRKNDDPVHFLRLISHPDTPIEIKNGEDLAQKIEAIPKGENSKEEKENLSAFFKGKPKPLFHVVGDGIDTWVTITKFLKGPFSGFGSSSGKKRAEDMEVALCGAHNMIYMGFSKNEAIKQTLIDSKDSALSDAEKAWMSTAEKCIKNLKGVPLPKQIMKHSGKLKGNFTDFWMTQYELSGKSPTEKTRTSKSDMICGDMGISLKDADGSQLLSGNKGETLATWQAAYDTISEQGGLDGQLKEVLTEFKNTIKTQFRPTMSLNGKDVNDYKRDFKNLPADWKRRYEIKDGEYVLKQDATDPTFEYEHKVKGKVKKFAGSASGFYAEMQDILTNHTAMQKKIREILQNKKVLTAFVHEAMSGAKKFDDSNQATATHIMTFDKKGNAINKKITMKYAEELLKYVNIQLNFKTSNKTGYTSVRGGVDAQDLERQIKDMVRVECYNSDGRMINEGLIKNIFGFFTKMFGRIFSTMKRILQRGFVGLKSLFGITDVDIKFNNNIKF